MRLGEYVKQYREINGLSLRDFARLADMSHQYIGCLEKGVNNEGKPLSPTMTTYSKVAKAVGKSESELMALLVDDVRVNPLEPDEDGYQEEDEKNTATQSDGTISEKDRMFLSWFRSLSPEKQKAILISQDAPEGLI